MPIEPPMTELPIKTATNGYYESFNKMVTVTGKAILAVLVIWALALPGQAASVLGAMQGFVMANFSVWYMIVMGGIFHHKLWFGAVACIGAIAVVFPRRETRIFQLFMVLDDVLGRYRRWNADLCDSRADVPLPEQSRCHQGFGDRCNA